jgi:hypothetical protein
MLPLDSPQWGELKHAYGPASDIPALLQQLKTFPTSNGTDEPWFSLWSAVPHVIEILATDPLKATADFLHFPAWVEICRYNDKVSIPETLQPDYAIALARLPKLVYEASNRVWDTGFLSCALSALAVGKNSPELAEVILELTEEGSIMKFKEWWDSR